ncbi:hypothetical protein LTR37_013396 [Vermiconidia calcicola]|uniref:Uncharacterized protein n=1 Tax=Vermiconidia calcicola TaxID=1690605 RepID=A0ACC3MWJ6_9PEZI|nr:hypothetical protein LTR37_013396 [Vermiconidia calcicola]
MDAAGYAMYGRSAPQARTATQVGPALQGMYEGMANRGRGPLPSRSQDYASTRPRPQPRSQSYDRNTFGRRYQDRDDRLSMYSRDAGGRNAQPLSSQLARMSLTSSGYADNESNGSRCAAPVRERPEWAQMPMNQRPADAANRDAMSAQFPGSLGTDSRTSSQRHNDLARFTERIRADRAEPLEGLDWSTTTSAAAREMDRFSRDLRRWAGDRPAAEPAQDQRPENAAIREAPRVQSPQYADSSGDDLARFTERTRAERAVQMELYGSQDWSTTTSTAARDLQRREMAAMAAARYRDRTFDVWQDDSEYDSARVRSTSTLPRYERIGPSRFLDSMESVGGRLQGSPRPSYSINPG